MGPRHQCGAAAVALRLVATKVSVFMIAPVGGEKRVFMEIAVLGFFFAAPRPAIAYARVLRTTLTYYSTYFNVLLPAKPEFKAARVHSSRFRNTQKLVSSGRKATLIDCPFRFNDAGCAKKNGIKYTQKD